MNTSSTAYETKLKENGTMDYFGPKTEAALLEFTKSLGCPYQPDRGSTTLIQVCPFSSERKKMFTVVKSCSLKSLSHVENKFVGEASETMETQTEDSLLHIYSKGASEIILSHCTHVMTEFGKIDRLTRDVHRKMTRQITTYSSDGLRTIGLAYKPITQQDYLKMTQTAPLASQPLIIDCPEEETQHSYSQGMSLSHENSALDRKKVSHFSELTSKSPSSLSHSLKGSPSSFPSSISYSTFPSSCASTSPSIFTLSSLTSLDERDMILLGIFAIADPIRPEVPKAVQQCQISGIMVRMVTGDNLNTARFIAKECGILQPGGVIMEGSDFRSLSLTSMNKVLPHLQVLARSSPQDKQLLVQGLKALGETVAVTGDGTNVKFE